MKRPRKPPWTDARRLANIRREVADELADGVGKREDPLFADRRMLLRLLDEAEDRCTQYARRWLTEPKETKE